ncbi:MAG: VOC family protein [Gemmataceae bacterium]|nr:VOC family protein [Gemmataceae bacterium]
MKRRLCVVLGALAVAFLALAGRQVHAQPEPSKALLHGVHSVGMTVSDMDRSVEFYCKVLSFEKGSDVEVCGDEYERLQGVFGVRMRVVTLRLGEEQIELTEYLAPRGRPVPADTRSNDHWFQHIAIIVSDMDKAYAWLRKHKVEHASPGPQRLPDWNKNAGGIQAFYFKDPDGHHLEILQFPRDKGDPRWRRKTDKLFQGIDHTAIVVSDTDASLKFYRDHLGFKVVGESENHGTEQERLNNVFGARLRITTLRAAKGPAVEFLEYVVPRDGRKMPADTKANDIWHWHIGVQASSLTDIPPMLRSMKTRAFSSCIVTLPSDRLGFRRGYLATDPDGHALLFTELKKGPSRD